ncbi:MAG TPA: hypothetical protein VIP46_22075 [Pyrinomonadaceae bacterium]
MELEQEYIIFALVAAAFGVATAAVARRRGGKAWQWFILGFAFGIVALPLAILLPARYLRSNGGRS